MALLTKIREKIKPGINPASTGTRAVAKDHVNTPISSTFLHQQKTMKATLDESRTFPES